MSIYDIHYAYIRVAEDVPSGGTYLLVLNRIAERECWGNQGFFFVTVMYESWFVRAILPTI